MGLCVASCINHYNRYICRYSCRRSKQANNNILIFSSYSPTWMSWCLHSCWIQFVCLLQECVDQCKSNFLIPIRFYLFFSSRFTLQQFYLWVFNLKPKAKFADLLLAEEGCTYFWKYTMAAVLAFFFLWIGNALGTLTINSIPHIFSGFPRIIQLCKITSFFKIKNNNNQFISHPQSLKQI